MAELTERKISWRFKMCTRWGNDSGAFGRHAVVSTALSAVVLRSALNGRLDVPLIELDKEPLNK